MRLLVWALVAIVVLAVTACGPATNSADAAPAQTLTQTPPTPTPPQIDEAFLNGMVPHHQAAVEMAKAELKYGKRADVKKLAQTILTEQQSEIQQMQKIAQSDYQMHPQTTVSDQTMNGMLMGEPVLMDMSQLPSEISKSTDPDSAFLRLMIPHHAMAIVMADTETRYGNNPQVRSLAQSMIASQSQELGDMQSLLSSGTPRATSPNSSASN